MFIEEAGGGQENGLEAEGLGQHSTHAEAWGLSLFCNAKSNPIYKVWKLQCLRTYQANIPCATQNRGQVLAAAKKVPFQK